MSSTIFVRRINMFPILFAWASTIHKVDFTKGLTLPNLAISLQLDKRRTFSAGQFYVAAMRATALPKVSLIGDLTGNVINTSASVSLEYYR